MINLQMSEPLSEIPRYDSLCRQQISMTPVHPSPNDEITGKIQFLWFCQGVNRFLKMSKKLKCLMVQVWTRWVAWICSVSWARRAAWIDEGAPWVGATLAPDRPLTSSAPWTLLWSGRARSVATSYASFPTCTTAISPRFWVSTE